jgi:hypothetical protein
MINKQKIIYIDNLIYYFQVFEIQNRQIYTMLIYHWKHKLIKYISFLVEDFQKFHIIKY